MSPNLNYLRCPSCKSELKLIENSIFCRVCNVTYPFHEGIPDFIPPQLEDDIKRSITPWEDLEFDYNKFIAQSIGERLKAIDKPLLEECHQGYQVLEVGCGTARLGSAVRKRGSIYYGLDPSLKMLRDGFKEKPNLVKAVGEYLPFADNSFDVILGGYHSFRYIDWEKGLDECARVIKPGGVLAFSLWNYWALQIYSIKDTIREISMYRSREKNGNCNDVKWIGREISRLRKRGFQVNSILSTRNSPMAKIFKNYFGWQDYWHGKWGTLIGYDIILISEKIK